MAGAMPQDHARTLREQKPLSRRTKWLLGLGGVIVVLAIVAIIIAGHAPKARRGCVDTTLPGVIGAQTYDECGAAARHTCATVEGSLRQFGAAGVGIVEDACRKGHVPVG
jgi:hypothetical protein